ncbi:hypothetical protein ERJ75_001604100 [Trypanosoma vivax]|uniref:Uncharacterized protein n=1 Tax=Trypanosoma vivax (strain Y486) TaxID=1055687 RepID=G0TSQ7_TRYVY|nr:hypothetical protein TRVL_02522 [Trypanosoma vivax]KAH8605549.1 hypothetical protein ERJ75_001604100 [Trypanosoma vivax]CCC46985.1 conserved hypothetical protein [Trypanosoma vivax Y486]
MDSRERQHIEKSISEVVAEVDMPIAQRHIRESLKYNKFSSIIMLLTVIVPAVGLVAFYTLKMPALRGRWRDPYELPHGFDPKTGQFISEKQQTQMVAPPVALFLSSVPGDYTTTRR